MENKTTKPRLSLYEYHYSMSKDIQISYKGPFDKYILHIIGTYIKQAIRDDEAVSKKLFKIFVELAQNIGYYSAETTKLGDEKTGVGTVVISEFDDRYEFMTGNSVRKKDIIAIIEKCEIINSLDRESLRKYKREQRNQPQSSHGGAHIGLIQVALTSANPLDFEVTPIDEDTSFFAITVTVRKGDKDMGD